MSSAFAQKAMRARDVRAAVEVALGAPIPASTVNEALSTHTREADLRFRRVAQLRQSVTIRESCRLSRPSIRSGKPT